MISVVIILVEPQGVKLDILFKRYRGVGCGVWGVGEMAN
jgi:hypothetical protein